MRFGFVTGGPGRLPDVVPRSPGDAVRLEARSVALGGPRLEAVLGDRLPGEVKRILGRRADDVSGIAVVSQGQPPDRRPIRVEGSNFDPVVASYRDLWEGQVRTDPLRLALRVSKDDLTRILPDALQGFAEAKNLTTTQDAFLGDAALLKEIGAGPFGIGAETVTVLLGPGKAGFPRIVARAPKVRLEPVGLAVPYQSGSRLAIQGTLSADQLTVLVAPQRRWEYRDFKVAFRAELPGDPGEKWALTIASIDGTPVGDSDFPLSRFRGKTFVDAGAGVQRRSR